MQVTSVIYATLVAVTPIAVATNLWWRGVLRVPRSIMPSTPDENAILRTWLLSIVAWYGVVTPVCYDFASEGRWLEALATPLAGALAIGAFAMAFGGVAELAGGRLSRQKAFKAVAVLTPALLILLAVVSFTAAGGSTGYTILGAFALAVLVGLAILWAAGRTSLNRGSLVAGTLRSRWAVVFVATALGFGLVSWYAVTYVDGWTRLLVLAAYLIPVVLLVAGLSLFASRRNDHDRDAGSRIRRG